VPGPELDDLKRRAYARPGSGADPAAAQAELAALGLCRARDALGPIEIELPRVAPHRVSRLARAAVGVLALATAIAAPVVVATAPVDSLVVFDRERAGLDFTAPAWLAPMISSVDGGVDIGARQDTIRWLASRGEYELFGYLTRSDDLCIVLVGAAGGGGSACTALSEFATEGISLGLASGETAISVVWGPTGDPTFSEAPRP
jgi:hypothetical protein